MPGVERAWGEGFREKFRDCRREDLALLSLPLSLRPSGLKARESWWLTVRIVLVYGFGYTEYLENRLLRIAMSASRP